MSHVRIRHAGAEKWYRNVRNVWEANGYVHIDVGPVHPYLVHYWRESGRVSVLICETDEDVTRSLREEMGWPTLTPT
jgi:hypothetical protein